MNVLKLVFVLILSTHYSQASEFISEASALCRVGNNLVIAGDEEKSSLWITDEVGKLVKTKVYGGKWDDMEALTAVNSHSFFGLTSLGLSKKGERKEAREKILLFSYNAGKIVVEKEWSLRDEVLDFLSKEASDSVNVKVAASAPPKEGGLNVEGVAYISGTLYLGLRSPLTNAGKAIILIVDMKRSSPVVSGWKAVDLKGNGIRDLSTDKNSLLILAGSSNDEDTSFGLYSMNATDSLSRVSFPGFSDLKRPEGILKEEDGSLLLVQDFVEEENQEFLIRLNP